MVVEESSSFIDEWEEKKKQNDSFHKRASKKMKDLWCVFSGKNKE